VQGDSKPEPKKPWRTAKVRRPRTVVAPYVHRLLDEIHLYNPDQEVEVHVTGSWRRGADPIGDIDLIVINETGMLAADLMSPGIVLPDFVRWQRSGPKIANGSITMPDGGDLHVDAWSCKPNERGAFLMFSTGPATLNVIQRQRAARGGMALSQIGLLDRRSKRQLDNGSEADIYRLLGLTFLTPEERQRWATK
jgi:DNA polymerase (family 10)